MIYTFRIICTLLIILFTIGDFIGDEKVHLFEAKWINGTVNSLKRLIEVSKILFSTILFNFKVLLSLFLFFVIPFFTFSYLIRHFYFDLRSEVKLWLFVLSAFALFIYIKIIISFLSTILINQKTQKIDLVSYLYQSMISILQRLMTSKSNIISTNITRWGDLFIKFNNFCSSIIIGGLGVSGLTDIPITFLTIVWIILFLLNYIIFYSICLFVLVWTIVKFILHLSVFILLSPSLFLQSLSKVTGQPSIIRIGKYIVTIVLFFLTILFERVSK